MNKLIGYTTVVLVTAALAMPHMGAADAVTDAKKAIQSAYNKANAAAEKKDIAGALANHAQDYTYIDQQGKSYDMAKLKAQLTQVVGMAKEIHSKTVIQSLTLKGSNATVRILETGHMVLANPQKAEQTIKVDAESKSEDLWTKTGHGWLLKRSRGLASKQWLNGKPFTPPKQ